MLIGRLFGAGDAQPERARVQASTTAGLGERTARSLALEGEVEAEQEAVFDVLNKVTAREVDAWNPIGRCQADVTVEHVADNIF